MVVTCAARKGADLSVSPRPRLSTTADGRVRPSRSLPSQEVTDTNRRPQPPQDVLQCPKNYTFLECSGRAAHHEIIRSTFQKHFRKVADIRQPQCPHHHFKPSLTMLKHHACAHVASGWSAGLSGYLEYANFRANFGAMFSLGEILLRF